MVVVVSSSSPSSSRVFQRSRRCSCLVVCPLQVEDEIQTLSQVLAAKERRLADIKRKLGVTPLNELKQNISRTWQEVTASNAYVPDPRPVTVCMRERDRTQHLLLLQLQTDLGDAVPGRPEGHGCLLQRWLGHHQEVGGRQVSLTEGRRKRGKEDKVSQQPSSLVCSSSPRGFGNVFFFLRAKPG